MGYWITTDYRTGTEDYANISRERIDEINKALKDGPVEVPDDEWSEWFLYTYGKRPGLLDRYGNAE